MKHKHLLLFLLFMTKICYAEEFHCLTVQQIKNKQFGSWLPLYKDNEELASTEDQAKFAVAVTGFVVAKWDKAYLENGHCFYQGNDAMTDKIMLAQDAWRPSDSPAWSWIKPNKRAECYSQNVADCYFKS